MLAPTGSGKTLAAFLWCLDRLTQAAPAPAVAPGSKDGKEAKDGKRGVQVLYVSPLKALAYDVERNLRAPLIGLGRVAARQGTAIAPVRIDVRTGDTPA